MAKTKPTSSHPIFHADRFSGADACTFTLSVWPEAFAQSNNWHRYKVRFYALSTDETKQHCAEWIKIYSYKVATDHVLRDIQRSGLSYFRRAAITMQRAADIFVRYCWRDVANLRRLDDRSLARRYDAFMEKLFRPDSYGAFVFLYEDQLSERFAREVAARSPQAASLVSAGLQSTYQSFMTKSEALLHRIAKNRGRTQAALVRQYMREYYAAGCSYARAPTITEASVVQAAKLAARHRQAPARRQPVPKGTFTSDERRILALLKLTEIIHDQRKRAGLAGAYGMQRYLEEASRRTGLPLSLLKRMFWNEYGLVLKNPKPWKTRLARRRATTSVFDGRVVRYLEYDALRDRRVKKSFVNDIIGTPASPGQITGRVRIVLGRSDFSKFKKGEILVTEMTRPDFLPIMRRAAAIITDEGGLTTHAAIVARELHIPCIVGTHGASRSLRNGQRVVVDATGGTVRVLD